MKTYLLYFVDFNTFDNVLAWPFLHNPSIEVCVNKTSENHVFSIKMTQNKIMKICSSILICGDVVTTYVLLLTTLT